MIKGSRKSGSSEAAWWTVLSFSLAAIAYMLFFYAPVTESGEPGVNPYPRILMRIIDGRTGDDDWLAMAIITTIKVVLCAQLLSFVIGVVIGGMGLLKNPIPRFLATVYVEAIRGIPVYVMLLFSYYSLSLLLPVKLSPFESAVIALGVCYGAYMAEVVRAGIESIDVSEIEAGMLEGGTYVVFRYIILPQALRTILPALANECIALLKDSAIVGVVTLVDITRAAQTYASSTFQYIEAFFLLGLIYLILSLILSRVQRFFENSVAA